MKLPGLSEAVVSEHKIKAYLLSPTHPVGRHKAVWLTACGFAATRWTTLADAIRLHATAHDVATVEQSPFGARYVIEGSLVTPDGRNPIARSVWFIERGSKRPQFVTLYSVRRGEP
jgi:hypothetical protein